MSHERLTRQELSWLLAQEARGAAKKLREGVSQLKQPGPSITATQPVETTLDTLDEAISKLSELQSGTKAARRGRIDLAALLYDLAPGARIAIEPGAGTEVFGEEAELRRMLHVLVSQTNSNPAVPSASSSPEVRIRRQDQWVRISVDLGPDSSATAELERRWLSRMATRHGGRLELESGTQSVLLPADGASDQREVVELRKELEQAQQLGEAYARELAAAFSANEPSELPPASESLGSSAERFELLVSTAAALSRGLRGMLEGLRADAAMASEELGEDSALAERLSRRVTAAFELSQELSRIAECPVVERAALLDVCRVTRDAVQEATTRAARHGVELALDAPDKLELQLPRARFELLLRALLDHAVAATPHDGRVLVQLAGGGAAVELVVQDGGPSIPEVSQQSVLTHRVDPASLGRPGGISLLTASVVAADLGSALRLAESPDGHTEVRALLGS